MTRSGSRRHVNWLFQVNSQIPRNALKNEGFAVVFFTGATEGSGVCVESLMACRVMGWVHVVTLSKMFFNDRLWLRIPWTVTLLSKSNPVQRA